MKTTEPISDNWDPHPGERTWYTHGTTGDRAYLVRRSGVDCLRLDRGPSVEQTTRITGDWSTDPAPRPLSQAAVARVAYVAHQELMRGLGQYDRLGPEWPGLSDEERIPWLNGVAPQGPELGRRLHAQVWALLREATK